MQSLSDPFIKRPVMTMLLYVSVLAFGIYSYLAMPWNDLPSVDYPVIQVSASYPGASPDVMANNIASPLEKQFLTIPGIELVVSNNSFGISSMVLQFHLNKSIDGAASDVQSAINAATGSLPTDLPSPPTFKKVNPNEQPVIYMGMLSDQMTAGDLYDYAQIEVAQRLQIVPGVANVIVYGSPRAVRIQVDPHKLYTRGLTYDDISNAIRQGTTLSNAGQIKGDTILLTVSPNTQLNKAEDYAKLIIAYRNGAPVFLRDVAECVDAPQIEDVKLAYWARGKVKPGSVGVVVAVTKASGANNVEVADGVVAMMPQIEKSLPPSIQVLTIYNRSNSIKASVIDVDETLLIAFVLVAIVVFLFLGRVRDTIIPVVALPMSLLMTFIVMHALDYTIDNLSLMALTLSVGFLIDDAIVFLENVARRMEAGDNLEAAVFLGAKEISFTILAMTLSLAAVFIPLVGMSGLMGRIFREFSVTIIVAIFSSGIVSLTLTPMMCSRILRDLKTSTKSWLERTSQAVEAKVLDIYSPALTWALRHWYLSVLAYFVCFFAAGWYYERLPKTFLPTGDSGMIFGIWIANTDISPTKMHKMQDRIIDVIRQNPAVEGFVTATGFSGFFRSNQGITFIALAPENKREPIEQVNQELIGALMQIPGIFPAIQPRPNLQISVGAVSTLAGNNAYLLSGLDADKVYAASQALVGAMYQSGLFQSVNSDYYPDNRLLTLNLNRPQASTYGVQATKMAGTIANAYSQNYSYLIKSPYQQYWVIVEAAPQYRARESSVTDTYFNSLVNQGSLFSEAVTAGDAAASNLVPFRNVAAGNVSLGPLSVNHVNGFTSVTISFNVKPDVDLGSATNFIDKTAAQVVPPTVTTGYEGDALVFLQTARSLVYMGFVALFVMYVILGILYESYVHPWTVLFSIPPAIAGGLATLDLCGSQLSLYSAIGLFMLAGIVKKNAIMMIDFAIQRQEEGRTPLDAVHEACLERFRPIIMTTLAAFFGAIPLVIGLGADAAARRPLGEVICGGLVVSQLLTLFVTPVTYLGFEWLQVRVMDRIPFFARRRETIPGSPPVPVQQNAPAS